MKKLLFIMLFLLSVQFLFCQVVLKGKWVIPTVENYDHKTFELSFMSDGSIIYDELPISLPDGGEPPCEISSGGYLSNFDLQFYFLGNRFCYGDQYFTWNTMGTQTVSDFHPEFQIINKPGSYNRYYAFYTGEDYDDANGEKFCFTEVYFENNIWNLSGHNEIWYSGPGLTSFGITNENLGNRFVYASTPSNAFYKASLKRWTINDQGIVPESMEILVDSDDPNLIPGDFSAYNLEVKTLPDEEDIIAWISSSDDSNEKIFIFRDGVADAFDLDKGRIGGIEFSDYNPDYLYVSCPEDGLIAINYFSGEVVQQLNTDSDYGHSYLQKAPDGHIYGVSNSGRFLGRINQTTGEFEPDVFEMPSLTHSNIVSTFREYEAQKFFILPEDSREYNPFTVAIEPTHVSCPGLVDGSAEAIVTGGQPDFTYQWYSWSGGAFNLMPGYIDPIAENLSVGKYKCCVTDANEDIVCQEIDITINPLLFSHPGQFWVINATPSEPVTANYEFELGIMVTNNSTLTLNNCYFQFGKYAKVIVEQGSTLILNNTVFTNLEACGNMWQGVEVWGNRNASQHTADAQGKLVLLNKDTIENAVTAVELWKPNDDNMTGGIIEAENSVFLNNARSIHAINYRNYNPSYPNNEVDYIGTFSNCSFIVNSGYLGDQTFYKHVDLDRVRGIKFYGCSFSLDHTASNVSEWNVGIAAYNAGFQVLPTCTTQVIPCPQIDSCWFSGFNWAIGVWTPAQLVDPPVLIQNAHFKDNSTGVYINNQNYAVILENFFEAGYNDPYHGNCDFADGVGIDIHQTVGFVVENNKLRKNDDAPTGHYAGIRVKNCPSVHDIIYKNELDGLSFGNYAEGQNRDDPRFGYHGVEYQCNRNSHNATDFIVTGNPAADAMIRGYHGSQDTASGNVFSRYTPSVMHFENWGTSIINYYYCNPCTDEEPVKIYANPPELFEKIISPEYGCPDHYGGGGHLLLEDNERLEKEVLFSQNLSDYNSVSNLYSSLVDGGDTEAEISDIQSAEPDDMWELRSQLLGHSPHLSQEVLRNTADRTDIFPDDVLLEILSANPDELNRDTLISFLEQKEDPLPEYMIEILRQAISGITYKTILEDELARYHASKTRATQDIIRSALYDSAFNMTNYRNWLTNMDNMVADRQIISSYLSENDTLSAITLLNLLPSLYGLAGEELEDYNDYKSLVEMQISWKANNKMMSEPDSTDIIALESLASDENSYAGNMARNILEYAGIHHYCNCLPFIDSTYLKNVTAPHDYPKVDNDILKISVEPNPAHTYVAFDFELANEYSAGMITISDVHGKLIRQFQVNGKKGQKVWDTSGMKAGVYYYNLVSSGLNKSGKIVIN